MAGGKTPLAKWQKVKTNPKSKENEKVSFLCDMDSGGSDFFSRYDACREVQFILIIERLKFWRADQDLEFDSDGSLKNIQLKVSAWRSSLIGLWTVNEYFGLFLLGATTIKSGSFGWVP